MKVVFLDIDGVLNCMNTPMGLLTRSGQRVERRAPRTVVPRGNLRM